jgi:hypothetical protein
MTKPVNVRVGVKSCPRPDLASGQESVAKRTAHQAISACRLPDPPHYERLMTKRRKRPLDPNQVAHRIVAA